MKRIDFELILEECLSALEGGASLDEVLKKYSDHQQALIPLLQAAEKCRKFANPATSEMAIQKGRQQLLAETARLTRKNHFLKNGTKSGIFRYAQRWKQFLGNLLVIKEINNMKLVSRLALYALVTVLVAGFFTVNASASSLPGDNLYGLKLGWEKARLALTFNRDARQELEMEFEDERLDEIIELISEGREAEVEFHGLLESKGTASWVISGFNVGIGPDTELEGSLEIGDWVEVEAISLEDGSLLALEITGPEYDGMDDDSDDDMYDDSDDDMDDDSDDDMDDDSDDDMDDDSDDDVDDDSDDDMDDDSDDDMDDDSDDDMDDDSDDDMDDESSYSPKIIEFTGMVDEMMAGYLVVDGTKVYTDYETDIEEEVVVGSYVEVEAAVRQDGSLLAIDVDQMD